MIQPNDHDRFVLKQLIRPVVNRYEFSLPESEGQPFCFVEQKRFKFKEDIRFFTDAAKTQELIRIKARQAFDPRARYDVTTATGEKIGEIQKVFGASLLRSTYAIFNAAGEEVCRAQERSLGVALFRRLIGFIPYVENFADWLPIPYHFEFKTADGTVLGSHERRKMKLRDTYDISFQGDPGKIVDRRMVLAIAVGMDALQAR